MPLRPLAEQALLRLEPQARRVPVGDPRPPPRSARPGPARAGPAQAAVDVTHDRRQVGISRLGFEPTEGRCRPMRAQGGRGVGGKLSWMRNSRGAMREVGRFQFDTRSIFGLLLSRVGNKLNPSQFRKGALLCQATTRTSPGASSTKSGTRENWTR